jgi:small-conductance mechanosensitive channel
LLGFSVLLPQFNAIHGVPMGETRLGFWLNLAVHIYIVIVFVVYREGLMKMMRGRDAEVTRIEAWAARAYPVFGIVVSLGMWWVVNAIVSIGTPAAFQLLGSAPHYKTMAILLFAPAIDTAIRGMVTHLAPPMTGEGPAAEQAYKSSLGSYKRISRTVVFAAVIVIIADVWGMSPYSLATAGVGESFGIRVIDFLMILSVGYLIYELVSLWINRKLAAEQTAAGVDPNEEELGGGEGGGAGGSRLSTVLPLILATSRAVIVVVFLLLALGNVGVDTTPLLAGAGIVGLAIGFGAQKLVTDVVSGIFFLVDDAFRTGEYVEVDGTMGTVEKISIRSMQLRHHKGPVHTIPYGEIPKLTNYSRDWVIMKLRFTVPFDTDPNKVKKIFKRIGAEMMEDPMWAEDFLQPFKSQGVFEIDDVGMVIRGKFMAKPGKQFTLRKEIFNKVKAQFEANGIDFARREVRVAIPGLDGKDDLTAEDRASIAAAATQAAQDMAEAAPEAAKPGD